MHVLYDVTRPLVAGMPVWPGDVSCRVGWTARIGPGSAANVAELAMSAHTGTHADGPYHALADGVRIGRAPLDAFLGPARVVDARHRDALDAGWITRLLAEHVPERVLVHTGAWREPAVFPYAFPALDEEAARVLVDAGVRLFGTDAPSVDPFDAAELPAHRVLLGAGVAILENLLLDAVPPGEYELIALPLRLTEADASPVRAVLRGLEMNALLAD